MRYMTFVGTLHCMLENGADLYVRASEDTTLALGLLKKEERMPNGDFFTSRDAYVNCAIIAMLYTNSIGNQP